MRHTMHQREPMALFGISWKIYIGRRLREGSDFAGKWKVRPPVSGDGMYDKPTYGRRFQLAA